MINPKYNKIIVQTVGKYFDAVTDQVSPRVENISWRNTWDIIFINTGTDIRALMYISLYELYWHRQSKT